MMPTLELGAKMMDFAGWRLPMQYSGIRGGNICRAGRSACLMFPIWVILVSGLPGAFDFLDYLLTRNMSGVQSGRALYSAMCNERGGTVDDLIVYPLSEDRYLLVTTRQIPLRIWPTFSWLRNLGRRQKSLCRKLRIARRIMPNWPCRVPMPKIFCSPSSRKLPRLRPFRFLQPDSAPDWLVSRTSYTGEDGFEIYLPPAQAHDLWQKLAGGRRCSGWIGRQRYAAPRSGFATLRS